MSLPAGTGVCVVKTVRSRTAVERLVERARAVAHRAARAVSSAANAAWPSFMWTTPGSIAERLAARRSPPTPSSAYCARRVSASPSYRREVIQRLMRVVLGQLGVEQEQRHAADVDPPDLRDDVVVADPAP